MGERMVFDVYATLTDPSFQVEHDELDRQVTVAFGGPSSTRLPQSMLNLWFTDAEVVLGLGRALVESGERLRGAGQERSRDSDAAAGNGG